MQRGLNIVGTIALAGAATSFLDARTVGLGIVLALLALAAYRWAEAVKRRG